jgi:hypothetical protein
MTDLLASVSEDVVNAIAGEEWAKLLKLGERPDEQTRKEVLLNGWADDSVHEHDLHRHADDGGRHHD